VTVYYFSKNKNGYLTGRRFSIDDPAATVMANGIGGDKYSSVLIADDGVEDTATMRDDGKPPYMVPSMVEIAAIPWNGLTVVSTFAGCGGSSLGYRMAGYRILLANEFVPIAQESYKANARAGTIVDGRDIKNLTGADVLKATGLRRGELDVLDGSPPCQAFSSAGRRSKGWGTDREYAHGAKQRNEDLFFEYVRLLGELRPRAFVAENVAGLVRGVAKGYFLEILAALKGAGYRVEARLLDAQWLGVPQQRERIVFVGVRDDLGLAPAFPLPLPHRYSVRDALPWLSRVVHDTSGLFSTGDVTDRPAPAITAGGLVSNAYHFRVEAEADISAQAIGREYDRLNPGQQSDKYFSLIRADADKPSPTVTAAGGQNAGIACVVHPTEKRKFSIFELRRLCSFPDDFVLKGTYAQQWERLGNSVPPLMMRAVAEALRDVVLLPARQAGTGKAKRRGPARARGASPAASGGRPSQPQVIVDKFTESPAVKAGTLPEDGALKPVFAGLRDVIRVDSIP
jgi:DNA (cytosine-5)-methyltransferase 1